MCISFWATGLKLSKVSLGKVGRKNKGSIICKIKKDRKIHEINAWDSAAVYVLYKNKVIIYCGRASCMPVGERLRAHCRDKWANKWDNFAIFSVSPIDFERGCVMRIRKLDERSDRYLKTLEGLLQNVLKLQNSRKEKIPNAYHFQQA